MVITSSPSFPVVPHLPGAASPRGCRVETAKPPNGIGFSIQSLPYSEINNVVVPLAIDSKSSKISIDVVQNTLPPGTLVYMEWNHKHLSGDVDQELTGVPCFGDPDQDASPIRILEGRPIGNPRDIRRKPPDYNANCVPALGSMREARFV